MTDQSPTNRSERTAAESKPFCRSKEAKGPHSHCSRRTMQISSLLLIMFVSLNVVYRVASRKTAFVQRWSSSRGTRPLSSLVVSSPIQSHSTSLLGQQRQTSIQSSQIFGVTAKEQSSLRLYSSSSPLEDIFASEEDGSILDFASMGVTSPVLLKRLEAMGLTRPTAVQQKAYLQVRSTTSNVTIGAETGSGKVRQRLPR